MDIQELEAIRAQLASAYLKANGAKLTMLRFARELGVDERKYRRLMDGDTTRGGVSRSVAMLARFMAALPVEDWPEWSGD